MTATHFIVAKFIDGNIKYFVSRKYGIDEWSDKLEKAKRFKFSVWAVKQAKKSKGYVRGMIVKLVLTNDKIEVL